VLSSIDTVVENLHFLARMEALADTYDGNSLALCIRRENETLQDWLGTARLKAVVLMVNVP
jgi:hypothetical protein